jgi:hypothetical protein
MRRYQQVYREQLILPEFPESEGEQILFFPNVARRSLLLEDGTLDPKLAVARGYTRVVIGKRGPYVEFHWTQINRKQLYAPKRAEWRSQEQWRERVYYFEYRTHLGHKMFYDQIKAVRYADYQVLHWYASPWDLTTTLYPQLINGDKPSHHL